MRLRGEPRATQPRLGPASVRREPVFAHELCRDLGLEPAKMRNDVAHLLGLLALSMKPCQLDPAVRTHGLQFGVALQRLPGPFELAQLKQAICSSATSGSPSASSL